MKRTPENIIDDETRHKLEHVLGGHSSSSGPFSERAEGAINKARGVIFELKGYSIAEQRTYDPHGRLLYTETVGNEAVRQRTKRQFVAVFPRDLFVPDSFDVPLLEQGEMLPDDTERLAEEIGDDGFELVMPDAPLVTEVALRLFRDTGEKRRILKGRKATGTATLVDGTKPVTASVGYFKDGLHVFQSRLDSTSRERGLIRVAIPRKNHSQ